MGIFPKETCTFVGEEYFISTVWEEFEGILTFNFYLVMSIRKV